jgi:hypothetical protein
MTSLDRFTFEYHRDRAVENLEMAALVLGDDSMPKPERITELTRLLHRIANHEAAMEIACEGFDPADLR